MTSNLNELHNCKLSKAVKNRKKNAKEKSCTKLSRKTERHSRHVYPMLATVAYLQGPPACPTDVDRDSNRVPRVYLLDFNDPINR